MTQLCVTQHNPSVLKRLLCSLHITKFNYFRILIPSWVKNQEFIVATMAVLKINQTQLATLSCPYLVHVSSQMHFVSLRFNPSAPSVMTLRLSLT